MEDPGSSPAFSPEESDHSSGSSIPADLIRSASVSEPGSVLRSPSTDFGSSIPADLIRLASVSRADSGSLRAASCSDTWILSLADGSRLPARTGLRCPSAVPDHTLTQRAVPAVAPWQTETWSCLRLLLDGDSAGANSVDAGARRLDHHGVLAGVQVVHQDIETFSRELRSETVTAPTTFGTPCHHHGHRGWTTSTHVRTHEVTEVTVVTSTRPALAHLDQPVGEQALRYSAPSVRHRQDVPTPCPHRARTSTENQ